MPPDPTATPGGGGCWGAGTGGGGGGVGVGVGVPVLLLLQLQPHELQPLEEVPGWWGAPGWGPDECGGCPPDVPPMGGVLDEARCKVPGGGGVL